MFDEIPYAEIAFDKSLYEVAGFLYYVHEQRNEIHNLQDFHNRSETVMASGTIS